MALQKIGRFGSRAMYLGPDGRTGMRYPEAKAAFSRLRDLQARLDAEIAYSMATGFGDHALVSRLEAAIDSLTH